MFVRCHYEVKVVDTEAPDRHTKVGRPRLSGYTTRVQLPGTQILDTVTYGTDDSHR